MDSPKLVINRIRSKMMENCDVLDVDEIAPHLSIDLIGIVQDDEEVIKGANQGEPIALNPNSKAGIAYRNIARRILGEQVPLQSLKEEKTGVFAKIKELFRIRS